MARRCDREFNHLYNARVHYKEKHEVSTDIFECSLCQAKFNIKRFLNEHLNKKHKITQKMLKLSKN